MNNSHKTSIITVIIIININNDNIGCNNGTHCIGFNIIIIIKMWAHLCRNPTPIESEHEWQFAFYFFGSACQHVLLKENSCLTMPNVKLSTTSIEQQQHYTSVIIIIIAANNARAVQNVFLLNQLSSSSYTRIEYDENIWLQLQALPFILPMSKKDSIVYGMVHTHTLT